MKRTLIVLVFVVLALVLAGGYLLRGGKAQAFHWTTQKVDTGDIVVTISASGTVEPLDSVQVGSQVSGKIKEILVQPDQRVKAGETLALIDPELLEADRRDKELLLKQAQSSLATLSIDRENIDLREKKTRLNMELLKVEVERGKGILSLAIKNLQRYQELLRVNATSEMEIDSRTLEKENAERDLEAKNLDLRQLAIELDQEAADRKSLEERQRQNELNVEQTQQALAKAVTNLSYASILSPITGVVLERAVDPGQTIAAQFQAPNLFTIVSDLSVVRIRAQLDEADVGKVLPGQKVTFDADAFKGQQFTGAVKSVRLKHEMRGNLVTYPVIIEAQNPPSPEYPYGRLRPGMTAYLTFEVQQKKKATRVPAAALRFTPPEEAKVDKSKPVVAAESGKKTLNGKKAAGANPGMPATVHVCGKEGNLKALAVRVGESDGEYYELLSNELKAGDEVVTANQDGKSGLEEEVTVKVGAE